MNKSDNAIHFLHVVKTHDESVLHDTNPCHPDTNPCHPEHHVMLNLFQHLSLIKSLDRKETKHMEMYRHCERMRSNPVNYFARSAEKVISLFTSHFSPKFAFTLAEMMVVMLILSIVMAAFAPVMTTRSKVDLSSPWRYMANNSDIYYGTGANQTAVIGANSKTNDTASRLEISTSSDTQRHILFKRGATVLGSLFIGPRNGSSSNNIILGNATNEGDYNTGNIVIGIDSMQNSTAGSSNVVIGNSVYSSCNRDALNNTCNWNMAIGGNSLQALTSGWGNLAIGGMALQNLPIGGTNIALGVHANMNANSAADNTIAVGVDTLASANNAISMGNAAQATAKNTIAIGLNAKSTADDAESAIAIGKGAKSDLKSISIGDSTTAYGKNSIAIGNNAITSSAGYANGAIGAIAIGTNTTETDTTCNTTDTCLAAQGLGNYAISFGTGTVAGNRSVAIGKSARAAHKSAIAIGSETSVKDDSAISIGTGSKADAYGAVSLGNDAAATAYGAISIGSYVKVGSYTDIAAQASGNRAISIGTGSKATHSSAIAIGDSAAANNYDSIAIGSSVTSSAQDSIAIGDNTKAIEYQSVAIGTEAKANGDYSIAIGSNASTDAKNSIAIGYGAKASNQFNIAIRADCQGSSSICIGGDNNGDNPLDGTILLGNNTHTVYIRGSLVVDGDVLLGRGGKTVYVHPQNQEKNEIAVLRTDDFDGGNDNMRRAGDFAIGDFKYKDKSWSIISDKRLKYVGSELKSGLDKIRQLKVYNYTFKKDPKKTPHVGVIAQDLQKVFPNAVTKGSDGYLKIRMEDMFYALINAVKELDVKVTALTAAVKEHTNVLKQHTQTLQQIQKDNKAKESRIKALESKNKDLEARLLKLEARK